MKRHETTLTAIDLPMYPKPDDWELLAGDIRASVAAVAAHFERLAIILSINSHSRRVPLPSDVKQLVFEALSDVAGDLAHYAEVEAEEAREVA